MPNYNNPLNPPKELADLMNLSNLAELEATYNSAGGIKLVAYLKYRVEFLSKELYSRPAKMSNEEKIEYISMINAFIDVIELPEVCRDVIKRKEAEVEMLKRRGAESGGMKYDVVR